MEGIKLKLSEENVENAEGLKAKLEELELAIKDSLNSIANLPRDELATPETEMPAEFMDAAEALLRGEAISGEQLDRLFQVSDPPSLARAHRRPRMRPRPQHPRCTTRGAPRRVRRRRRRARDAATLPSAATSPSSRRAPAPPPSPAPPRPRTCSRWCSPTRRPSPEWKAYAPTT
jgi:hypothetical protein